MKRGIALIGSVLVLLTVVAVPRLFSAPASQLFPVSLYPTSDATFDLGTQGTNVTLYRWNSIWSATGGGIGATNAVTNGPEFILASMNNTIVAPGSGYVKLYVTKGSNAGTCAVKAVAGTSATPVTIADNIGAGGC